MEKREPADNPYAAPRTDSGRRPRARRSYRNKFVFKDPSTLGRVLQVLLGIGVVLVLVSFFITLSERSLLAELAAGNDVTDEQLEANDQRMVLSGLLQTVLYLATVVVFCFWIYRVAANAHAMKTHRFRESPGWCVGWFFIPLAHLWKPCQAMMGIWLATVRGIGERRGMGLIGGWWTLWILGNLTGQISGRLSLRAVDVEDFQAANTATLVSSFVDLPLHIVTLLLVTAVTSMQVRWPDVAQEAEEEAEAAQAADPVAGDLPRD